MRFQLRDYIIIILFFLCSISYAQTSKALITKQRAIFLINTANQFKWESNDYSDKETFEIAILGDKMLYKEILKLASTRKVNQLKLKPEFYINLPKRSTYDLIYSDKNLGYDAFEIIKSIDGEKVLFIGENYRFNECFVNLIFLNDEFVYEINEKRLSAHGFIVPNALKNTSISSSSKWYELFLESQKSLDVVKEEVKKQQDIINRQIAILDSLNQEVVSLEDQLEKLKTDVLDKQNKISILENRKIELEEKLIIERNKIESLKNEIVIAEEKVKIQLSFSDSLNQEINSQKSEIIELAGLIDQLKKEVKLKREKIKQVSSELSTQKRNNLLLIFLLLAFLIIVILLFRSNKLRKKNYKLLEEKNKFIEERRKEMEQFTYAASHDLQDPLNATIGFGMLLKEKSESYLPEDDKLYLDMMLGSSERMKTLIRDLLEYSKIGIDDTKERFTIKEVMDEIIIDLDPRIKSSKAEVKINDYENFTLHAKKSEIRRAISNLISNGIKYQPVNQVPEIEVDIKQIKEKQKFKTLIKIKDNGIGIEDKFKDKIFDVFKRLHNNEEYEGTGIGLANCKKIIDRYDGEIWVEDNPDGGSVFVFYFFS